MMKIYEDKLLGKFLIFLACLGALYFLLFALVGGFVSPATKIIAQEQRREKALCANQVVASWAESKEDYKWSEEGKNEFRDAMKECEK